MTIEDAIRIAQGRARTLRVDPQLTVAEVYEAELLRRLQPKFRSHIVWKGGTVLRLEGSERFSRDLDATRRTSSPSQASIHKTLKDAARGLPYLTDLSVETQPNSVVSVCRFDMPGLGQPLQTCVEISTREKVLLAPTTVSTARIAHPCGIEPVIVARLDDPELLAEKVRALVMRMAGRDIFDVYWLLQRGVEFDPALFLRKMRYYEKAKKPIDPTLAVEKAARRLHTFNPSRAKTELVNLLPAAQRGLDIGVIVEDVARALDAWLLAISEKRSAKPAGKKKT